MKERTSLKTNPGLHFSHFSEAHTYCHFSHFSEAHTYCQQVATNKREFQALGMMEARNYVTFQQTWISVYFLNQLLITRITSVVEVAGWISVQILLLTA